MSIFIEDDVAFGEEPTGTGPADQGPPPIDTVDGAKDAKHDGDPDQA